MPESLSSLPVRKISYYYNLRHEDSQPLKNKRTNPPAAQPA